MIDSRDFLAARKRADTEVHLPQGTKIAFTGGLDFNDHRLIWDTLDKVHAKLPDMVLLHGGSPKGAELIASKWDVVARTQVVLVIGCGFQNYRTAISQITGHVFH